MPERSKIQMMPEELREELDRRLVEGGFRDYRGLAKWLCDQGFEIGHSSVWAYGTKFEQKLEGMKTAAQQAKVIVEQLGDDENAMGEALLALAQHKAFEVLREMESEEIKGISFPALTRSVAELNRSAVQQKKFADEVKNKIKIAVEEADKIMTKAGVSDQTAAQIRAKFLGIEV